MLTICGCDNKIQDSSKDPEPINEEIPKRLNMNRMISHINDINSVLKTDKFDQNDFIMDADGTKFYKYTGDNIDEIFTKLGDVYRSTTDGAFFRGRISEGNKKELYVHKPENCKDIVTISINDVIYDEPDEDSRIPLRIYIEDKGYDYTTNLTTDENGYYKFPSPIYPCIHTENDTEDN